MNQTNSTHNVPVLRLIGLYSVSPDTLVVVIVRITVALNGFAHTPAPLPDHRTNEVVVRGHVDHARNAIALPHHDAGEIIVPDHNPGEIVRLGEIPAHGMGDIIVLATIYIINTRFREARVDHSCHWRIIFGGSVFEGGYVEAAAVGFLLGVVLGFVIRGLFFLLKLLRNA